MNTLSYGYNKPQSPDTGDIFFPGLEANWQQVNDHNHDGGTSAPLASQTQTTSTWSATTNGTYRQLMTVPTGLSYDTCQVWVKRSTGEACYPTLERASSTTFYIYTNDNSLTYNLFYR